MMALMELYQNRNFKLILIAGLLIGAVLFPYGWLANEWQGFGQFMNWLFATEGMHVVGHLGLYMVLGTAVLLIVPRLGERPYHYFGFLLSIGLIQEALQLLSFKHHFFSTNEFFDLGVDLVAAGLAFAAWKVFSQKQSQKES
ncbi:MAG: hypothetical protein H6658_14280 [Ardenticatenaceae bacterium]|nr:hypothetical protein [Ardenticatenaceae bacterium]